MIPANTRQATLHTLQQGRKFGLNQFNGRHRPPLLPPHSQRPHMPYRNPHRAPPRALFQREEVPQALSKEEEQIQRCEGQLRGAAYLLFLGGLGAYIAYFGIAAAGGYDKLPPWWPEVPYIFGTPAAVGGAGLINGANAWGDKSYWTQRRDEKDE